MAFPFDLHSAAVYDSHTPRHALLVPRPCRAPTMFHSIRCNLLYPEIQCDCITCVTQGKGRDLKSFAKTTTDTNTGRQFPHSSPHPCLVWLLPKFRSFPLFYQGFLQHPFIGEDHSDKRPVILRHSANCYLHTLQHTDSPPSDARAPCQQHAW